MRSNWPRGKNRAKTFAGVPNCHGCQGKGRGNKANVARTGWNKRQKKVRQHQKNPFVFMYWAWAFRINREYENFGHRAGTSGGMKTHEGHMERTFVRISSAMRHHSFRLAWSLMQERFPYFIHEFEPCRTIRTASCRHGVFSYCPPNEPWHPSFFLKRQT